ncbi:MAG: Rap1a/Tai family immunity protein [Proteobacteria bacterium]|nr:Rap1a/Tai family immunity protein [Pseudomonadota bacterium]
MKKISFIAFIMLFLNFGFVSVYAEEEEEVLSGQELVDGCSEGYLPGKPNQYCMQYMFGLVQTLAALQEMEPGNKLFCIDPTAIGLEEVTDNVTKWMENSAERLHEDAYILATQALHESYPCSSANI